MILMDVKGLNWVGNVYQKFEAMCLEVEEIMHQDALKYVDNQVETIGASFRRLYSDVMKDLVPPSTDDPRKQGDSDSPALNYTDTGRYRNRKTGIGEVSSRLAVEKNSDVVTDVHENVGHTSNLHRRRGVNNLPVNSSGGFAEGASTNLISRKRTDDCFYSNSNLGVKERLQKDSRGVRLALKKKSSASSSFSKFSNDVLEASDCQMTVSSVPAYVDVASLDSVQEKKLETEKTKNHVFDASAESLSYDVVHTVKSDMEKETEIKSSHDDMPETSTAEGKCVSNAVASPVCSLEDGDELCRVSFDEAFESSAGRTVYQNLDGEASYMNITDQAVEAIQHDVQENLEECVIVDGEELPYVPYKDDKQKVHKKGIRKVLSSRKNSVRQQEYVQLATWYATGEFDKDCDKENSTVSGKEVKVPPTGEVSEPEWELL